MTPVALDITVASIILLSTLVAYFRGIIKEVFTIFGLFVASFMAYKAGHLFIPAFDGWLGVPEDGVSEKVDYVFFGILSPAMASKVLSYGGTFFGVLIIVTLLGRMFARWIKEAGMESVDRWLGAGFGFLRGFLVLFIIYLPLVFIIGQEKFPDWAKNSYSVSTFNDTFEWLNKEYKLNEKIENDGDGVKIKFDKEDTEKLLEKGKDKFKKGVNEAKESLKEAIEKEEQEKREKSSDEKNSDSEEDEDGVDYYNEQ